MLIAIHDCCFYSGLSTKLFPDFLKLLHRAERALSGVHPYPFAQLLQILSFSSLCDFRSFLSNTQPIGEDAKDHLHLL
ncbi:hypothetical protein, partial [Pseudomonas syringae]|uniref:hypothetical protein n=1 Tax=Pseudomonas syringae TaxID=317 RepID=UPI001F2F7A55